jgi:hypothetical protein
LVAAEVIHSAEAIAATHFTSDVSFYNAHFDNYIDDQSIDASSMGQNSQRFNRDESMTESIVYSHTITPEGAQEEGYGMPETEEEMAVSVTLTCWSMHCHVSVKNVVSYVLCLQARASAGYFIEGKVLVVFLPGA